MAESIDLDVGEAVDIIQRISHAIDSAWEAACRTGAATDLVVAVNEASLALHRAQIALSGAGLAIRPGGAPSAPIKPILNDLTL